LIDRLVAEAGDPATGRAVGAAHLLYSNLLPVYGAADVRPHNPLAPIAYLRVLDAAFGFHPTMRNYFANFDHVDHPLLDFLGVRAVVGSPAIPTPKTLLDVAPGRFAPFSLYRNADALPRWFLPIRVDVIERKDLASFIRQLDSGARVAVFRDEMGDAPLPPPAGEETGVRARRAIPGRIELALPAGAGERLLATSIPRAAGWRAVSPERKLPLVTVDGAFVGVRVPAGVTRVTLAYVPPGFVAGSVAAAAALLVVLRLIWAGRRGRPSLLPTPA
jgi:hypothetical protein